MKTELKLKQRLKELSDDLKSFTKDYEAAAQVFAEKKKSGDPEYERYSPHTLELMMAEAGGKLIILKEVLEIKD